MFHLFEIGELFLSMNEENDGVLYIFLYDVNCHISNNIFLKQTLVMLRQKSELHQYLNIMTMCLGRHFDRIEQLCDFRTSLHFTIVTELARRINES